MLHAHSETSRSATDGHIRVASIVLTYLNWRETVDCVADLLVQDIPEMDIVVVDNASPNDSYAQLCRIFAGVPRVFIIRAEANRGYAAGNNTGMRWRLQHGPVSHFVIVNNDTRLSDRTIVSRLVEFAEDQLEVGLVGPRVISENGFPQGPYSRPNILLYCCRYCLPVLPYIARLVRRVSPERTHPRACFANVGAFFLVKAEPFISAGLFDERTFLGAEEYIVSERLRVVGYKNYYYPAVTVLHNHARSAIRQTGGEAGHFNGGLDAMSYYFSQYQGCSALAVKIFRMSARLYEQVFLPLRKYAHL